LGGNFLEGGNPKFGVKTLEGAEFPQEVFYGEGLKTCLLSPSFLGNNNPVIPPNRLNWALKGLWKTFYAMPFSQVLGTFFRKFVKEKLLT